MQHDKDDPSIIQKVEENLNLILDQSTPTRVIKVFNVLYQQAVNGDIEAIKLWLAYAIGDPIRRLDFSSETEAHIEDGDEWKYGIEGEEKEE